MKRSKSTLSQKKGRPLNLRDFPDDLYWKCKVSAAQNRMTLKKFVMQALQQAVSENSGKT